MLADKVALVTGAGIGGAIAETYLACSYIPVDRGHLAR
jgi:NAD(P)-dependent dehydrogenase (short-subunit alcohol dehydrogenase family)